MTVGVGVAVADGIGVLVMVKVSPDWKGKIQLGVDEVGGATLMTQFASLGAAFATGTARLDTMAATARVRPRRRVESRSRDFKKNNTNRHRGQRPFCARMSEMTLQRIAASGQYAQSDLAGQLTGQNCGDIRRFKGEALLGQRSWNDALTGKEGLAG